MRIRNLKSSLFTLQVSIITKRVPNSLLSTYIILVKFVENISEIFLWFVSLFLSSVGLSIKTKCCGLLWCMRLEFDLHCRASVKKLSFPPFLWLCNRRLRHRTWHHRSSGHQKWKFPGRLTRDQSPFYSIWYW